MIPTLIKPSSKELYDSITTYGAIIVEGVVSDKQLETIIEETSSDFKEYKKSNIFALNPNNLEIAFNTSCISKTLIDTQVMNEDIYGAISKLLRNDYEVYWGDEMKKHLTPPLVSSFYALKELPGFGKQPLHRGDSVNLVSHKAITSWDSPENDTKTREALFTTYLCGSDDVKFNLILGSHLWNDETKPESSLATTITLKKSQSLILLGSTYFSYADNEASEKLIFITSFSRGIYRQEQNMFLTIPKEILRTYGEVAVKRLGYDLGNPFLGWVDLRTPLNIVFPERVTDANPEDLN